MAVPVIKILDASSVVIPKGTAQVVSGHVPGTPTAFVTYQVTNDGPAAVDTAFNVTVIMTGRLVSVGGDFLSEGLGPVDERFIELQLLDGVGGNVTSKVTAVGLQASLALGDLEDGDIQVFRARVFGLTETAQVELLLTFQRDHRSTQVGDHVGTGSGIYRGVGDGETTDLIFVGSYDASGTPDEFVAVPEEAWEHKGLPQTMLAGSLVTNLEDSTGTTLAAGESYWLGITYGRFVEISGTWSITAATSALTGTGGAADTEVAADDHIMIAGEIHEVASVGGANAITLETTHTAGATTQPAFIPFTVTKGAAATAPQAITTRPAIPVGELERLWIEVEEDATIEQADIYPIISTAAFFQQTNAGLDVTINRGRAKVHGYDVHPTTPVTISLDANETNLVQIAGPDDASVDFTTDDTLNEGSMSLFRMVTDGASVTSVQDLRGYQHDNVIWQVFLPEAKTAGEDAGTFTNASTVPMHIRPGSLHFEAATADPSSLGFTGGRWLGDIGIIESGIIVSIFRSKDTNDQRPQFAFDATNPVTTSSAPELLILNPGQNLIFTLVEVPTGPGTDVAFFFSLVLDIER